MLIICFNGSREGKREGRLRKESKKEMNAYFEN